MGFELLLLFFYVSGPAPVGSDNAAFNKSHLNQSLFQFGFFWLGLLLRFALAIHLFGHGSDELVQQN